MLHQVRRYVQVDENVDNNGMKVAIQFILPPSFQPIVTVGTTVGMAALKAVESTSDRFVSVSM